jgi:hypothetical protein
LKLFFVLKHSTFHFQKQYLLHLKTNSNDFCDIKCAKKRATKYFHCLKAMDQCGESYKTLFIKVFHILIYLTILNIQYVLLWRNTFQMFYPIFFPQRKIQMNYIKTTFSLLVRTLYFMSSIQWKVDFCF